LGKDRQIAGGRRKTGKGIDFEKIKFVLTAHPEVQTRHITQPKRLEKPHRSLFNFCDRLGSRRGRNAVIDERFPIAFDFEGVAKIRFRRVPERDLHRPQDLRLASDKSHRDFSSGDIAFHQNGLFRIIGKKPVEFPLELLAVADA